MLFSALGILEQALKTAAVLGYNYPGSSWYGDTYQLISTNMPDALKDAPMPGKGPKGVEKPLEIVTESSPLTSTHFRRKS